jgi:unsaturated rhamnogalacturonyl hydrolase
LGIWILNVFVCFLLLIQPDILLGQKDFRSRNTVHLDTKQDPEVVGRKLANNITKRKSGWRYPKVCSYYGGLIFADAIGDSLIRIQLMKKFEPWLKGKHETHSGHVDFNVFGIWPFEIFRHTGDEKYLNIAKRLAEDEYKTSGKDGLATYTRFWVDDMYMVGSLQAQAYKSLKDTMYLNRAARQLVAYCFKLQRPNGLFFHRDDAPFYWGRGNGWAAAAMAEVLPLLPPENKYFAPLMSAYQKMMNALIGFQGKDGMWHQLIDDPETFAETSCTGMFLFAMATGLENGWLPRDEYVVPVIKSWEALAGYVNEKGAVREVCVGTNAKNNRKHYLTRPRRTGNFHGQAAVLWAATAMIWLQR